MLALFYTSQKICYNYRMEDGIPKNEESPIHRKLSYLIGEPVTDAHLEELNKRIEELLRLHQEIPLNADGQLAKEDYPRVEAYVERTREYLAKLTTCPALKEWHEQTLGSVFDSLRQSELKAYIGATMKGNRRWIKRFYKRIADQVCEGYGIKRAGVVLGRLGREGSANGDCFERRGMQLVRVYTDVPLTDDQTRLPGGRLSILMHELTHVAQEGLIKEMSNSPALMEKYLVAGCYLEFGIALCNMKQLQPFYKQRLYDVSPHEKDAYCANGMMAGRMFGLRDLARSMMPRLAHLSPPPQPNQPSR